MLPSTRKQRTSIENKYQVIRKPGSDEHNNQEEDAGVLPAYMTVALLLNTRWHWSNAGTWWSRWKVLRSHWCHLLSRL